MTKKMDKQLEKLTSVLTESDMSVVKDSIKARIDEGVTARLEGEIQKLNEQSEKYLAEKTQEIESEVKAGLIKEYDVKLAKFEKHIVEGLDNFLDKEIASRINEDVLKKVAINEAFRPMVEGFMTVFDKAGVSLDRRGKSLVEGQTKEIAKLKKRNNQILKEKMEAVSLNESVATKMLLDESTASCSPELKAKAMKFFEGKKFAEVEAGVSYFIEAAQTEGKKVLTESRKSTLIKKKKTIAERRRALNENKSKRPSMFKDVKTETKQALNESEIDPTLTQANYLLGNN